MVPMTVRLERRFKFEIPAENTGKYEITSTELEKDPNVNDKVSPKQIQIELPQAEAAKTEANLSMMQALASKPENFANIWDVDKLMIPAAKTPLIDDRPHEIWDKRFPLILVVLLLTAEWVLRKKFNMT